LPVLVVITIVALFSANPASESVGVSRPEVGATHSHLASGAATAVPSLALKAGNPAAGSLSEVLASDALPPGAPYVEKGTGAFRTLAGSSSVIGKGTVHKFSIEVEDGLGDVDVEAFAATAMETLRDSRSWAGRRGVALQRVGSGEVAFHLTLVSAMTVRGLCGYDLPVETSCYSPADDNRVVLNLARWVRGDVSYLADLASYHQYMINHEVGHALGHNHIFSCLPNGLAPVMMQQTITMRAADGKICKPNSWSYPR
jgi:hypothetical protein